MTTQTEVNPLDELDFEPAKTCECMLVADDGTLQQVCDNPAGWYGTCPVCKDHGYFCTPCKVNAETDFPICDGCGAVRQSRWIKL